MPVARLQVSDLDQWIVRMRKAGVGESSIRNQLQTLRSALGQAVRWGWISQNPGALVTYERPKRTARDVMTAEEVHAVLAVAEQVNEMAPVLLRLAAVTGARRAELAALKWSDLDCAVLTIDSAITVVWEGDGDDRLPVVRDDPTKTADRRRVALDADTVAMLEPLRAAREPYAPWLFSETKEPPKPDRLGWWWRRCRDLAGIDKAWRLHDLRHWSATFALSEGYDLATVAGRLGHSDPSTTLRVYAHARSQRDVDLATSLGEALRQ
jgi:integrase